MVALGRPDATWANVGDAGQPVAGRTPRSSRKDARLVSENIRKTCEFQHISLDDAPAREVTVLSRCVAMVAAPQLEPRIPEKKHVR